MDQCYRYPCLPLAVYRELAAHLRQVDGLAVEFLPQMATTFDYSLSQLGGLQLQWDDQTHPQTAARAEQILAHYRQRYPEWMADATRG